jgi:YggT family protein
VYAVGYVLELLLWAYLLLLFTRWVVDLVQSFARAWSPRGPVLFLLEIVYTATDPPIRLLRRVIPPLRLGAFAFDLSIVLVLLLCYVALAVNRHFVLYPAGA